MKRASVTSVLATLALFAAPGVVAASADTTFRQLADDYIDGLVEHAPVYATSIGDHRADDRLDDVDAAARERTRDFYLDHRKRLAAIDRSELSRANQVDAAMLANAVESALFELETLEEWAWNPLHYVNLSGQGIYGLLARDFAPIETRLASVASRLEQLPRFLAQARASIKG